MRDPQARHHKPKEATKNDQHHQHGGRLGSGEQDFAQSAVAHIWATNG